MRLLLLLLLSIYCGRVRICSLPGGSVIALASPTVGIPTTVHAIIDTTGSIRRRGGHIVVVDAAVRSVSNIQSCGGLIL